MAEPLDLSSIATITTVSDSLTNDEPTNWLALLGRDLGIRTVAEAHGGWTTKSYFKSKFDGVAFANLPADADLCIILIGSNNLFEDGGGSQRSIDEAVAGVQRIAAHVVTIAPNVRFMLAAPPIVCMRNVKPEDPKPQRRIDSQTPEMLRRLSAAYRDLARRRGWLFVDLQPVLTDDDYVDGAHPGDDGNRKIAAAIAAALREADRRFRDDVPLYEVAFAGHRGRKVDIPAATQGIWRWTFRCGRRAIAPGGAVRLRCEVPRIWMRPLLQKDSPDKPGFVGVEASDGVAAELIEIPTNWKDIDWATVRLPDGLQQGQQVTVQFGSPAHPLHAVAHKYRYAPVSWMADHEATGQFYRTWPPMVVRVVPGPAAKLNVVIPADAAAGEPLRIRGRVEDAHSNVGARHDGEIRLRLLNAEGRPVQGFEQSVYPNARGLFEWPGWQVDEPGLYRVEAAAEGLDAGVSNAAVVHPAAPARTLLWGDAHAHSMWADGVGTIDDNFLYARDEAMLDVFGLSEHLNNNEAFDTFPQYKEGTDYSLLGPHVADAVRRYYEPGRFVTLLSAEYSPSFKTHEPKGDFCIYPPSDDFGDLPMARECPDMLALARRHGCLCIPHVGGHIIPWEVFPIDPDVTPVLEIAAMHGRFERFAQEALQQGYRMGFVGMADGHFGMPGYDNWPLHGRTPFVKHRNYSQQGAITAFVVDEPTREGVLEAMRRRRCYATTGQRIGLDFTVGGAAMGGELSTAEAPTLHIEARGAGPIALVEVIRGDRRVLRVEGQGRWDVTVDWTDPAPLAGPTWYYVRVTQEDNAIAWSSPIWVDYTGPGGATAADAAATLPAWNDGPYWPEPRPETADPAHLARLRQILAERELTDRFIDIRHLGTFPEPRGRFALFHATDAGNHDKLVHIHLYVDFADDRLYIFEGASDYGAIYKWE